MESKKRKQGLPMKMEMRQEVLEFERRGRRQDGVILERGRVNELGYSEIKGRAKKGCL